MITYIISALPLLGFHDNNSYQLRIVIHVLSKVLIKVINWRLKYPKGNAGGYHQTHNYKDPSQLRRCSQTLPSFAALALFFTLHLRRSWRVFHYSPKCTTFQSCSRLPKCLSTRSPRCRACLRAMEMFKWRTGRSRGDSHQRLRTSCPF